MKHLKPFVLGLLFILLLCAPLSALASEPLNINQATALQLQQVNGIGPKTAAKIVRYRQEHGNFASVDDLSRVKGIGQASLAKMSSQLCCN